MEKLLFLLVFIPLVSIGQDYGNSADAIKLCSMKNWNPDWSKPKDWDNLPIKEKLKRLKKLQTV
jgi:hypothetical protein